MLRPTLYAVILTALFAIPALADGPVYASPQSPAPPTVRAAPQATQVAHGDPYGFGTWLNGVRARMGLHALAHEPALSHDAAINSSRGFGHSYMGRARRQNAGLGAGSLVWPMWISSGAHASALFDRSITRYGIACVNGVWTYNAY